MEKITKKKDINKEKINEILEKYNLKAPKKTQISDKNSKIQKKDEPIINVIKNIPQQVVSTQQRPIQKQAPQQVQQPVSPVPQQRPVQKQATQQVQPIQPVKPISQRPKSPQQAPQHIQPVPQPPQQKTISINNLLQKDTQDIINNKSIIPQAIVSKNHKNDFLSNNSTNGNGNNIYNMIPKINPQKQYSHLNSNPQNYPPPQKHSGSVKKITIHHNTNNPNTIPNQEEFQNTQHTQHTYYQNQNPRHMNVSPKQQIKTIITQPQKDIDINGNQTQDLSNTRTRYRIVKRKNTNTNTPDINYGYDESDSSLTNLEMQRQYLQEQQIKELEKLKFKKEQIMKIHNRKKEIELMKSIEKEKAKLRLIQTKQEDLNKLMNSTMNTNMNTTMQSQEKGNEKLNEKVININTASTLKNSNNKGSHIVNVDEKRTKKNMSLMKDVIDVIKQPTVITRVKSTKYDAPIVKDTVVEANIDSITNTANTVVKSIVLEEQTGMDTTIINNDTINMTDNIDSGAYKYYYKKDIKKFNLDINWGTPEELYNRDKMTEPLVILLNIKNLFPSNIIITINKDTRNLEEKIKILQNVYNFKKIKNFKDNLVNLLYNIFVYDDCITIQ